jgi:signal transduction histidine kinase
MRYKTKVKENVALVVTVMASASLNILTGTKTIPSPGFDMVPVSFSVFLITISLLTFKYKIIDIIPIAYYKMFSRINSAAIIMDREGNILEYNPLFKDYFSNYIKNSSFLDIHCFLEDLKLYSAEKTVFEKIKSYLITYDENVHEEIIKITKTDNITRHYSLSIIQLSGTKGQDIGKLITLTDITDYGIATVSVERKRLSGDLHDSLGNCINIISSNLEYALNNFSNLPEIRECIDISYRKCTTAFLHLRRIVEELRPIDIEDNGLLWALQSMFYRIRMKGINIDFSYNGINDALLSRLKHGETIYYICQEAVNNSVIHGKADNINITIMQSGNQVKLYILDDGIGCEMIVKNKGLQSMEERTRALEGKIEYGSPTEGGFNIKVVLPIVKEILLEGQVDMHK